jgi:hypothetical protein
MVGFGGWKIGLFEEDEKQFSLLLFVSLLLFSVFLYFFFGPFFILPQPVFIVVM